MTRTARVAIVYPGDRAARQRATPQNNRFADLFAAFAARGVIAEPAVYHDDFSAEVRVQLLRVDAALVWVNPLQDGRDRSQLDALLRELAGAGVFVSAHPDVILKLGTKDVLYRTRELDWGCDTHRLDSAQQLRRELPARLAGGAARVLKQFRGNGGDGVWKVQLAPGSAATPLQADTPVCVRHAKRGCVDETIALQDFVHRCEPYFAASGYMIDQAYQERLPEGTTRCYLVHDRVAGFGHQAINALHPAPPGAPAPQPGPRRYHPPTLARFRALKSKLEQTWVPALQQLLHLDRAELPVLWDCDFLLGAKDEHGADSYVLCEINASSVAPYPESACTPIVEATLARVSAAAGPR